LNAGRVIADGKPPDVLNRYQKIIMEREEAYDAETSAGTSSAVPVLPDESLAPLSYTYRHGDGSAEIVGAELTDAAHRRVEICETGEPLIVRVIARFHQDVEEPVVGFLIRNRHGIHAYGTNTKEQQIEFGPVGRGEGLEVSFAFSCWLGVDQYSISFAIHSRDGQAYDWLDGALFFNVTSLTRTEGVANLDATATARRRPVSPGAGDTEESVLDRRGEGVAHG
jgi:hypothetical protein